MITKEQAMTHKGALWHMYHKNKQGIPVCCRVNGKCQTWKRNPEAFKLPIKIGLRTYGYITNHNANEWCVPENWAVESVLFQGVKS